MTTQTYAAQLTPPGVGAIATIAIDGAAALNVIRELFQANSHATAPAIPEFATDRFWLGRFGDPPTAQTADHVVLAVTRLQPTPRVEIHCHGGVEVVRWLLELLSVRGIQVCAWQELESWSSADPFRSLAARALADAPTVRTAGILLDQYHGAFARAIDAIQAVLDVGDEVGARRLIDELAQYGKVGRHLTHPWRVAVMGAPNVGKSSLVNALAGFQRSIVAPTPGTTRDVVTTLTAVDGWPVELIDTAGLRNGDDELERQGIELARSTGTGADVCLWILDASTPPVWPDAELQNVRLVVNKTDLSPVWNVESAAGAMFVSAYTGSGVADLIRAMGNWLVPNVPPPRAPVPFTPELADQVEKVKQVFVSNSVSKKPGNLRAWFFPGD